VTRGLVRLGRTMSAVSCRASTAQTEYSLISSPVINQRTFSWPQLKNELVTIDHWPMNESAGKVRTARCPHPA
jgi:hypothetical protein